MHRDDDRFPPISTPPVWEIVLLCLCAFVFAMLVLMKNIEPGPSAIAYPIDASLD
jgi:hypothetical protein